MSDSFRTGLLVTLGVVAALIIAGWLMKLI
jgi:hypothetical protein